MNSFSFFLKGFQLLFSKCYCENVENYLMGFEASTFRGLLYISLWLFIDDN